MTVQLFRRHHTPEELGAMLYETLRAGMASDGELSVARLVADLHKQANELEDQYVGEVMIGSMFSALLSVERSTTKWMAEQITAGMVVEFLHHLKEQGAGDSQIDDWRCVVSERFKEFRESMKDYEGLEPPWKLGRQLYWNMLGVEEYVAVSIKVATQYMLAARDAAQKLLNEYGPTLVVNLAT